MDGWMARRRDGEIKEKDPEQLWGVPPPKGHSKYCFIVFKVFYLVSSPRRTIEKSYLRKGKWFALGHTANNFQNEI